MNSKLHCELIEQTLPLLNFAGIFDYREEKDGTAKDKIIETSLTDWNSEKIELLEHL